ncbi:MAG: indolepyruvate oxidoreductase subunit beta [Spirochaetota bacterium]|jgi:indolepyruvate ferredoxin oxidoreductase beta subunit|nr:indolepyruvate oxidoreductase subunit beta [Spirochaetota bacterium]
MNANVLIVGVGGQGTILASDILAAAALEAGLDARKSEIHGMSQRGGSVSSHVRFSPRVFSPVIPDGEADILVALEEMEAARWLGMLKPGARLIISGTRILPVGAAEYPEGIVPALIKNGYTCTYISPEVLHARAGGMKYENVCILGLLSRLLDFPDSAWYAAIERLVPTGSFEANRAAFDAGRVHDDSDTKDRLST